MKILHAAVAAVLVLTGATFASAQSVSLEFRDGTVSLSAKNAPLRTILAEWARVGGAKIVNAERVPGGPMTLEFSGVSEREALQILLRDVSGYIAAPRRVPSAGASAFDRILILPTSAPVSSPPPVRAQQTPPVVFFPGDPDENPAGERRVTPEDFQRQLREAAARAGQQVEQGRGQQGQQVEQEEREPAEADNQRDSRSRSRGSNRPFGNIQGSSRPGEITTAPQQSNDDDDPD